MIEILVDGTPAPVNEAEYLADPDKVEADVRANRIAAVGVLDDEPFPDYDTLEAIAAVEAGL